MIVHNSMLFLWLQEFWHMITFNHDDNIKKFLIIMLAAQAYAPGGDGNFTSITEHDGGRMTNELRDSIVR